MYLSALSAIWLNRSIGMRQVCLSANAAIKSAGRGMIPIGSVGIGMASPAIDASYPKRMASALVGIDYAKPVGITLDSDVAVIPGTPSEKKRSDYLIPVRSCTPYT